MSDSTKTVQEDEVKPLTLLLEDNERVNRNRRKALSRMGLAVLSAHSAREAWNQVYSSPTLEYLVCDINLVASDPEDKSGYVFAEKMRDRFKDILIFGYSGHFEKEEFRKTSKAVRVFNGGMYRRNDDEDLMEEIGRVANDRASRPKLAKEIEFRQFIQDVRESSLLGDRALHSIRAFAPYISVGEDEANLYPDRALARAGYKLIFIGHARGALRVQLFGKEAKLAVVLPIWVRKVGSRWFGEVFSYHEFSGSGASRDGVVKQILEQIHRYSKREKGYEQSHRRFAKICFRG